MKLNTNKKILFLSFLVLALFSIFVCGQENSKKATQNDDSAKQRAKEIITEAQKAISKKTDVSKLKSVFISFEGTFDGGVEIKEKNDLSIVFPNKVRIDRFFDTGQAKGTTIFKLNENVYAEQTEAVQNGKNVSKFRKAEDPKDEGLRFIKSESSNMLLPIILGFPWYAPLEFSYVGVAEAENVKADVLEAISATGVKYQLLFGRDSHQLLMMIKSRTTTDNKPVAVKYFFSDYKENSGLNIPHKITIQGDKTFEEKNIKNFKINPEFNSDLFVIKDK